MLSEGIGSKLENARLEDLDGQEDHYRQGQPHDLDGAETACLWKAAWSRSARAGRGDHLD
jgi:hypothetical protein